jgi:uncharacterized protein YjeT (DUF2065 family)
MLFLHVFTQIAPIMMHVAQYLDVHALANVLAPQEQDVFQQLSAMAGKIQEGLRNVGIAIFVIGVIVAGMMRMLAFGSDRRVMFSNMALTGACVGLAIVLLAVGIKNFLCGQLSCK